MYPLIAPFALRDAEPDDHGFLWDLYFWSREDLHQAMPDAASLQQLVRMQQQAQEMGLRHNYPQARHFIVQEDAQPVGRAVIHAGNGELRLLDIAVAPAARRHGAATAVLQALQSAARQQGARLGLSVRTSNAAAGQLYRKLGFAVASHDEMLEEMVWHAGAA